MAAAEMGNSQAVVQQCGMVGLGGIGLGMEVWDDYERELKVWEATEAAQVAKRK
jgi:hypothetical protein